MKKLTFIISLIIILTACNKKENNFTKYEWIIHYTTYDKDFKPQEKQRTFFRNDSVISFSKLKNKEFLFPIEKSDSTIVVKQQLTFVDKNNATERDTIIIDTFLYDFKNIFNMPILVIKSLNSNNLSILTCKNENSKIQETNNFLTITHFKIGGLSIGDTIEQSLLTNFKDCDGYNEKGLVEARLIKNNNIYVKLINKKIIYSIRQEKIEDDAIENIIEVVSQKIKTKYYTIEKIPFLAYKEGYRWKSDGIEIELSKQNMTQFYIDKAEEEKDDSYLGETLRYTYLKLAEDNLENDKYWTLEYDDELLQNVLKFYQNNETISTIIE